MIKGMSYYITSKTTGEFFRINLGSSIYWTEFPVLAMSFSTHLEATTVAICLGLRDSVLVIGA